MDLFALAKRNSGNLQREYDDLIARLSPTETAAIDSFVQRVDAVGHITINLRLAIVADFIARGDYLNIHGYCALMASLSGRPVATIFAEKLGIFSEKRLKFDNAFTNGAQYQYGALSIGGLGPVQYGEFCIALRPEFDRHRRSAYLKDDSLKGYLDAANSLNLPKLEREIAVRRNRAQLAALKHATLVVASTTDQWPSILCSNNAYIEVVFPTKLNVRTVAEVRVSEADLDDYWNLAFADFSRKLSPGERAIATDFIQLLDAAKSVNVEIRGI